MVGLERSRRCSICRAYQDKKKGKDDKKAGELTQLCLSGSPFFGVSLTQRKRVLLQEHAPKMEHTFFCGGGNSEMAAGAGFCKFSHHGFVDLVLKAVCVLCAVISVGQEG